MFPKNDRMAVDLDAARLFAVPKLSGDEAGHHIRKGYRKVFPSEDLQQFDHTNRRPVDQLFSDER